MKRKISSFVTAILILMVCAFAGACGNKYEKMEFEVLYAFSENATVWYDGTNGISLNYDPDDQIVEGEEKTSLIFDGDTATLYIKVVIKNVKDKDVDLLTISPTSMQGLKNFSSTTIAQNQVMPVNITGNVNTVFKIYENNSGKKFNLPTTVSRELKDLSADLTKRPAMALNGSLSLAGLNNLIYYPIGLTNQTGVIYSVDSIGYYKVVNVATGAVEYTPSINTQMAKNHISIENNNTLKVANPGFFDDDAYVVRVKATSAYHTGEDDPTNEISTYFDVYLVKGNVAEPVVKFNDNSGKVVGYGVQGGPRINLYDNGPAGFGETYSKSTIYVDTSELATDNIYFAGVNTHEGKVKYNVAIYVQMENGLFQKYDFENQKGDDSKVGLNGLFITQDAENVFTLSIAQRNLDTNRIKVVYEIDGLDFSQSQKVQSSSETITVFKSGLVSCISVNSVDLDSSSEPQSATVYHTSSASYKGLELKIAANPNNDNSKTISLINEEGGLEIFNKDGEVIRGQNFGLKNVFSIISGSTVFVKFKEGATEEQHLILETLAAPTYFNEKDITAEVENDSNNFIRVTYNIKKSVTANKFEFVKNANGDALDGETININAQQESEIYVKIFYSGNSLDESTIKLTSSNEKVLFKNILAANVGVAEILLENASFLRSETLNGENCAIYKVPVMATNEAVASSIEIFVVDPSIEVSKTVMVSSVYLMEGAQAGIDVNGKTGNVKKFGTDVVNNGEFNFAVSKGEFVEFGVVDGNNQTKTIAKIELEDYEIAKPGFSNSALNYNAISNSVFVVTGKTANTTQALTLKVYYYSEVGGSIGLDFVTKQIQIAVFDSIGTIDIDVQKDVIGFVNPYYTEISSTKIDFNSYTSTYGTPANSVLFDNAGGDVVVAGASQVRVDINNYYTVLNSGLVSLKFVSDHYVIEDLLDNGLLNINENDFLSGSIIVELSGEAEDLREISLTLTALRFGQDSSIQTNIVIKIAKVDKAKGIIVNGDNFVNNQLRFSFIDVEDDGYDEQEFEAGVQFETATANANNLRFEDINTALTHILYQYVLDADGNVANKVRIQDDFFNVVFQDGKVQIRAHKNLGGGVFKLVLATKDSYSYKDDNGVFIDPEDIIVYEEHFDTTFVITVRVEDGELGSEYTILTEEELNYINYNLDKHFVLGANLGEYQALNIEPLGLIGGVVAEFTGSLSGTSNRINANEESIKNVYSINLVIEKRAYSTNNGDLFGLFAVLGEGAVVQNLMLDVAYSQQENNFQSTDEKGSKIGSVAAVNKGLIKNVLVNTKSNNVNLNGVTEMINFGLIAGYNENIIQASKVQQDGAFSISSNSIAEHNIGLIAGTNVQNAQIVGKYLGKESLNNFVFDVVADFDVYNLRESGSTQFNIGGVAGKNNGLVKGMLVGGKISMSTLLDRPVQAGSIGGLVGLSTGEGNKVELSTALSLNIESTSNGINVGGIIGQANDTTIDTVKFVSATTKFDSGDILGKISGESLVAGVVAKSTNATIKYASVESFVDQIYDLSLTPPAYVDFHTIEGGEKTAGLVAEISGTSVDNSFVTANINSSGIIYLTADVTQSGTYFVGKVNDESKINATNYPTYRVVNGKINGRALSTYAVSVSVDAETTDWTNIYVDLGAEVYEKAESYDATKTYVKIDMSSLGSGSNWATTENYNVVTINNVDLFFPYLIRSWDHDNDPGTDNETEPLQIVKPLEISANINQSYVTDINSVYVDKYEYEYKLSQVKESVIVNFFNGATDEQNTHNLFATDNDGLLDVSILPEDAQGGYAYEIVGDGYLYAYINDSKQIVFTGASGKTPILVRVYSVFNTKIEVYVTFYSQSLFTELTLNSSSIYSVNQVGYDYEINTYTGQNNKILVLGAENENSLTVFDVYGIEQYLEVQAVKGASSKLEINTSTYNNITLKIKDLTESEKIVAGEYEIINFELYLKEDYFDSYLTVEKYKLGDVKLKVNLYNSAKSIAVDESDKEITTHDDISFNVALTTDFVNASEYETSKTKLENDYVNSEGEIRFDVNQGDSLVIVLSVIEGNEQTLIDNVNKTIPGTENDLDHFAQLFDVDIISNLYTTEGDNKVIGYTYNIMLELKDQHVYRYITDDIKFKILVTAQSNPEVNNSLNPMIITLKPAVLSTARIENYKVTKLNVNTDYTTLLTNEDIQTSIVEPGSLGNVMLIYLEPTYSNVVSAKIKTSSLYVPSLGKNVQLKFSQLVLDKRGGTNAFSTLTGELATTQVGDTLDLKLISTIESDGSIRYDGVICVYIQLERFNGLEATMSISLDVETSNGLVVSRTRDLLTTYIPSIELKYNPERGVGDGYLVQKGTAGNQVELKIYGYQFNSNPKVSFAWNLIPETDENGNIKFNDNNNNGKLDEDEDVIYQGGLSYVGNQQIITDGTNNYLIGDYVSYFLNQNYDEIKYNAAEDSYTIVLTLSVSETIPAAFSLGATLSLTTKDGQLYTSEDNRITFYPTEYILNSVSIANVGETNRKSIAIDKSDVLELAFTTDSTVNDMSETIYQDLLDSAQSDLNKILRLFTYYKNGSINFSDHDLHTEFEVQFINNKMTIKGVENFTNLVNVRIWYGYKLVDGEYVVDFTSQDKSIDFTFTLNIFAADKQSEIFVYSVEDIYDVTTGTWKLIEGEHYVLMNDITIEQVVPITTKIASFDGNNRKISIKSFRVDVTKGEYGLFANIGTYTVEDPSKDQPITRQTILKNMIVDYGEFEGSLALNNNTIKSILFGGLVASNNGGLIYNCDVINTDGSDKDINLIVAQDANVTFGGLVASNSGIITNSRVGRDGYTRIVATPTTESTIVRKTSGLTFNIFNRQGENDEINLFSIVAGGFVGSNTGTIATSYVSNTNLVNYSTNETTNMTSGFVGNNSGTISYSYAKADDSTITTSNPYSTGYRIENKGNGIVSGFVYTNSGNINNSYANLELKTLSAYISGFVYSNNGTISECYAATTMNAGSVDSYAEQPFVGVSNAGTLLSNGTLENTYYLMRSTTDNPHTDGDKDIAQGLNEENFQNSEYLIGFAFVLSNYKAEREQGIWSYYTLEGKKRILPELMNANVISHSYRYIVETESQDKKLTNAVSFAEGTANNPFTISNVEEFNKVFTSNGTDFAGYVRFINDINFNDDETAIQTRANFTLGADNSSKTSIEGNGMTISGIYLDVGEAIVEKIGLFAEIKNAYIKNLNLNFATPTTDGQFSTTTATYSGGLAGTILNSAIINIKLNGVGTTLTGSNFVGGVAGLISGNSLVYGIETNLSVKTSGTESFLYYSKADYEALNIRLTTFFAYEDYLKHLSYAGGVAGVLDLTPRSNVDYNVQFIDIRGDQMSSKIFDGRQEANILAEYAGGVAGYSSKDTKSFKLRYFMGKNEIIRGDTAVGGLYGVALGSITASQVTAEEDTQYVYDTSYGSYILALSKADNKAAIDTTQVGNMNLLEGYKYVGGLVGVGLDATITASYSKASIKSGEIVGGLIGVSVKGIITYSYAIPYINIHSGMTQVGGLVGAAYGIAAHSPARNNAILAYETLVKHKNPENAGVNIQFTYSTLILDDSKLSGLTGKVFDYVVADYQEGNNNYLQSNQSSNLIFVYAGTVNYLNNQNEVVKNQTNSTNKSSVMELFRLYNVGDPDQIISFQEVFSGWALIKYWTLNEEKYFPLLNNKVVNNYIDINDAGDFKLLETNPYGKFRVISDDIVITENNANWIVSGKFRGVLIGEIEGVSTRPTIKIKKLKPNQEDSTGFFKETHGATISNIAFEWEHSSIDLSNTNVKMVSSLSCKDTNSLISNVEVRVTTQAGTEDGQLIADSTKTIEGFGGIVGHSINTNILGSVFVGKVKATLSSNGEDVCVGATVGSVITDTSQHLNQTAVLNNANVGATGDSSEEFGANTYQTTSFEFDIGSKNAGKIYIGGSAGKAQKAAIAANKVGGTSYETDYTTIELKLDLSGLDSNIYVGGVVGYAEEGMIVNSDALTNITLVGSCSASLIKVGGLAGEYSVAGESLTAGISKSNTKSLIKTYDEEDGYALATSSTAHVILSTGVAELATAAKMTQCLFTGEINTENEDSSISILYAGGAVGLVSSASTAVVDMEEISTNAVLCVGTENTTQLYAGGLIGKANKIQISYSVSWGRIIPITSDNLSLDVNSGLYVGSLIGLIDKILINDEPSALVNNSYTTSSIVADSIADTAITELNIGALVGQIPSGSNIKFSKVYYSSDYALFADENYVDDQPLGTNYSAQMLLRDDSWHEDLQTEEDVKKENIWLSHKVNGQTRVPYLTYSYDSLVAYGIINSVTQDYVDGSAMKPKYISGDTKFESSYTYYLLIQPQDAAATPALSGALNGILLGQDLSFEKTFRAGALSEINSDGDQIDKTYYGIISAVLKHSAVSNFHVVINSNISQSGTYGIIAGINNGVIFNSSVQGTGRKLEGAGTVGLIAGVNNGMISYSYSTAEIISSTVEIGGITHTNNAKLLSNYFTGYIESDEEVTAAGILHNTGGGYVFNNYMAGVITNIKEDGNAFFASASIIGSNNFIDSYSDLAYKNKEYETEDLKNTAHAILKPVETSKLMAREDLIGEWYATVENGNFDTESIGFGLNYNYPIYRFNRIDDSEKRECKHQLFTGTGVVSSLATYEYQLTAWGLERSDDNRASWTPFISIEELSAMIDIPEGKEIEEITLNNLKVMYKFVGDPEWSTLIDLGSGNLDIQYDTLVSSNSEDYKNAFKIPHLGVLTAVQNLLNSNRNYVVIYDLDGQNEMWTAIGSPGPINGFNQQRNQDTSEGYSFNGVFVTNKYYDFNSNGDTYDQYFCKITNLKQQGLFADIDNAYFGDIKLGNFTGLDGSGALGTKIKSTEVYGPNVFINNILFVGDETQPVVEISGAGDKNFAGLFGEIAGYLQIDRFNSNVQDLGLGTGSAIVLKGGESVGLIVAQLTGTIDMKFTDNGEGLSLSSYIARFDGSKFAGGLVGKISGGTIFGNGNVINISNTDEDEGVSTLGGVAAVADGVQSEINNLIVELSFGGGPTVLTDNFGGIVAIVKAPIKADNITITSADSTEIQFLTDANLQSGETKFIGLAVGLQEANLNITNFALDDNNLKKIVVKCSGGANYSDETTSSGVGVFVGGKTAGATSIDVVSYNEELTLQVEGIPNVGAYFGYVNKAGDIAVTCAGDINPITVTGTTNVGGFIGYLISDIDDKNFAGSKSVLTNEFAKVAVVGPTGAGIAHQNYGGWFGRWDGSNGNSTTDVDGNVTNNFVPINNNNTISIRNKGEAYNVGGVVGKLVGGSDPSKQVGKLTNSASFDEEIGVFKNSTILSGDSEGKETTAKLINVGGVVGNLAAGQLVQSVNKGSVKGYQNVGGIVGYVNPGTKLTNNESIIPDPTEDIEDANEYTYGTIKVAVTTLEEKINSGEVRGVINVGGAVGCADNAEISLVYTTSNVFGNASVGGLVGLIYNSTIKYNYIQGGTKVEEAAPAEAEPEKPAQAKEVKFGVVKGIYYQFINKPQGATEATINSFIPTSVGGLVGTVNKSTINLNVVNHVQVISSLEGESADSTEENEQAGITPASEGNGELKCDNAMISTISNHMAKITVGDGNDNNIETLKNFYDLDQQKKLNYNEISSGFGGLAGTIDADTMNIMADVSNAIYQNLLVDIDINAQLGVNVGTYFGAYKYDKVVTSPTGMIPVPMIKGQTTKVDGSYNIGGIVGFIDGGSGRSLNALSNDKLLPQGTSTINLQSRLTGMYVGGLVGKTNADKIEDFVITTSNAMSISINTSNCYYAGGLIGRAEVNSNDASISGNVGTWTQTAGGDTDEIEDDEWSSDGNDDVIAGTQDNCANFGGLIGMLKVGFSENGLTVNVTGKHNYPFTINTIENSNYYDGDSEFNVDKDSDGVNLHAEAFYINKDNFKIAGSMDETLYDNDGDTNPLNDSAKGWSKQYSGFKVIQRNIPYTQNNGAGWDSIAVLFDAAQITHVGTIGNLNLNKNDLTWPSGTDLNKITDDHICFTVYEQADGQHTLYSAMGIASLYYESTVDDPTTPENEEETRLAKPHDRRARAVDYINAFISETSTQNVYYINYNSSNIGLTYFDWAGDKYESMGYKYTDIKNDIKYQNESGSIKYISYYIDDYLSYENETYIAEKIMSSALIPTHISVNDDNGDGSINDKDIPDYTFENNISTKGAYFVFDVVYENGTLNGSEYSASENKTLWQIVFEKDKKTTLQTSDTYLPTSGSIFEVIGVMSPEAAAWQLNDNAIDWFAIGSKIVKFVAAVVLAYFTGGGSLSTMFNGGMSALGKGAQAAWKFAKAFAKSSYGKVAGGTLLTLLASTIIGYMSQTTASAQSYSYFVEPSYVSYGYISTTFSKNVLYEMKDDKIVMDSSSDYTYKDSITENIYDYISSLRPGDYHTHKYVGLDITGLLEFDESTGNYRMKTDSSLVDLQTESKGEFESLEITEVKNSQTIQITDSEDGDLEIEICDYVDKQTKKTKQYMIVPKYQYHAGHYYVYSLYGKVTYVRASLDFQEPTDQSHYSQHNNNNYVRGTFNETYYYNNDYEGNNLSYKDKQYSINGTIIEKEVAENSETSHAYQKNSLMTTKVMGTDKKEGYNYFTKAYYTANGNSSLGMTKYATFGDRSEDEPNADLRPGIDYVVRNYQYTETITNADGEDVEITHTVPYYYYLQDTSFAESGTPDPLTLTTLKDSISVAVYPATFVNPYTEYSNLKNSLTIHDGGESGNGTEYTWYINEDATSMFINFNPKYFLYEGGYVTSEVEDKMKVFTKVDESKYKRYDSENEKDVYDTLNISKGAESKSISFKNLIEEWDEYKSWSSVKHGEPLISIYYVRNSVLYQRNDTYTLRDGLLHYYFTNRDEENLNINENLYLSNSDVYLYTRYKYSTNSVALDFSSYIEDWKIETTQYNIIPKKGTTINSNYPTKLTESVRVVLNGGKIRIGKTTGGSNPYREEMAGSIVVI